MDAKKIRVSIRHVVPLDVLSLIRIEEDLHQPMTEVELRHNLQRTDLVGVVASVDGAIVGYCIYALKKQYLVIERLGVAKKFRRKQIGLSMMGWLLEKMIEKGRYYFEVMVPDSDLDAQLFCRAASIVPVKVVKNYYQEPSQDGYLMRYTIPPDDRL